MKWHPINFSLQKLKFSIDDNFAKCKEILLICLDLLTNSLIEVFIESWLNVEIAKKLFTTNKIFLFLSINPLWLLRWWYFFQSYWLVWYKTIFLILVIFKATVKIEFWWRNDYTKMFQKSQENKILWVTCSCYSTAIRQLCHQCHQAIEQS